MIIPTGDVIDNQKLNGFINTLKDIGDITEKIKLLIGQAYFLLRSVKYNGNKKCIVFFTTVAMTTDFQNILIQLAKLCNIDIDVQIIVNDITQKQRSERIKIFRESDNLAFLLSVHILDEGIDIPECDSVFVTKPDEDIDNLIQRISRCNRMMEGKNKPCTYLWCEYKKIKNILNSINSKFVCDISDNVTTLAVKANKTIN
jgi:superfamily II DNA or RNA helicase